MVSAPFQSILKLPLAHTDSAHFLAVLNHPQAGVSTNTWLRILHNRVMDLAWLFSPVLTKRAWPKIRHKHKRGTTWEEHQKIILSEKNPEYRLYYELLWESRTSAKAACGLFSSCLILRYFVDGRLNLRSLILGTRLQLLKWNQSCTGGFDFA